MEQCLPGTVDCGYGGNESTHLRTSLYPWGELSAAAGCVSSCSPSLVFAVDAQGVAHIRTLDSERGAAEVRYETETEMPEGSWLRVVTLRLSGREVSYTLSNGLCGTLCSGRVRGTVRDALAVRLALAQDADGLMQGQDSLCVSLSGEVSEIRKISISR